MNIRNQALRTFYRLYPFVKGRYRLMKLCEEFLVKEPVVVSRLYGQYQFDLDLRQRDLQSSFYFFMPEFYEHETQNCIKELLRPGMTAVDIGAHIGLFTLLLADRVGKEGRVFSFEPAPDNYSRLKKNVELNGLDQVKCFPLAAAKNTGSNLLMLNQHSTGHALYQGPTVTEVEKQNCIEIKTIALDDFVKEHKIERIDLMKIDAEGSEYLIFEGAQEVLKSNMAPQIICEIHSSRKENKDGKDSVRRLLYDHGYRSYVINTKLSKKKYLSELKPEEPVVGLQNLLFRKN